MNLYLDNSNVIELRGLTNSATGVADTGATVAVTLYDPEGVAVSGGSWPLSMTHDSIGTYRATMPHDLSITKGLAYTARVSVAGSGGQIARFNCRVIAEERFCE